MHSPTTEPQCAEHTFLFPGRATDTEASVLATGTGDANTAFLGLSARSDTGQDADYIRWHTFDHVPEQARIPGVRNAQRWVSTPECRAARRVQTPPFEAVDHAVQYLFGEPALPTIEAFMELGGALAAAERQPLAVPRVQSAVYTVVDRRVSPKGTLGAFALPWWPATGIYLTIEPTPADKQAMTAHREALGRLVELDGVAGAWRYAGMRRPLPSGRSDPGQTVTVFYLYADPVSLAGRLGDLLEGEWDAAGTGADFAAPFHVVRPLDWDRYLP